MEHDICDHPHQKKPYHICIYEELEELVAHCLAHANWYWIMRLLGCQGRDCIYIYKGDNLRPGFDKMQIECLRPCLKIVCLQLPTQVFKEWGR